VTFGALLFLSFAAFFLGIYFGMTPFERTELVYPPWSFAMWAALFAVLPIAGFVQHRRKVDPLKTQIRLPLG
jgi:hypothetical protein